MDTVQGLLMTILTGLGIGVLARVLLPGPDPMGWLRTILVGIAGSFLGSLVARVTGIGANSMLLSVALSVAGAMLILLLYRKAGRRSA